MTALVNTETGEIVAVDPQETAAVARLTTAITALTEAVDSMPIAEVVSIKAQVTTIQAATKELRMSQKAQDLAAEAVRRSEWSLAMKIREGQEDGTVASRGYIAPEQRNGGQAAITQIPDLVGKNEWRGPEGIAAIADAAPSMAEFDAALAEAKAEGNLSRANVARKAREMAGKPERAKPRRALADQFFDAAYDLTKVVERIDRLVVDDRFPQNAEKVSGKHRSDLLRAVELLSKALDRLP